MRTLDLQAATVEPYGATASVPDMKAGETVTVSQIIISCDVDPNDLVCIAVVDDQPFAISSNGWNVSDNVWLFRFSERDSMRLSDLHVGLRYAVRRDDGRYQMCSFTAASALRAQITAL